MVPRCVCRAVMLTSYFDIAADGWLIGIVLLTYLAGWLFSEGKGSQAAFFVRS